MDLSYSDDEKAFRDDVRAFMDEKVTPDLKDKVRGKGELSKADMEQWHATLNARGWLAPNWPKKFGGAEWNAVQKHIFRGRGRCRLCPAHRAIWPWHAGTCAAKIRVSGAERLLAAAHFERGKIGGVRAIPSRARGLIWRR